MDLWELHPSRRFRRRLDKMAKGKSFLQMDHIRIRQAHSRLEAAGQEEQHALKDWLVMFQGNEGEGIRTYCTSLPAYLVGAELRL
jgi:hypothetical protein